MATTTPAVEEIQPDIVHLEGEPAAPTTFQQYLGTIAVLLAFICVLAAYITLQVTDAQTNVGGPLDDLLLLLGGAVAGVAADRTVRR